MTFLNSITRNFCRGRTVNYLKTPRNSIYKNTFIHRIVNFRTITVSAVNNAYDAEPQTIGRIINKKYTDSPCNYINLISSVGFTLSSGVKYVGPMIIFPHLAFSWNVYNLDQVTEESLCLFKILEPKLDILVFGYGSAVDYTPEQRQRITKIFKGLGIPHEILPTEQACGVYNFLSDEQRFVAAALLLPRVINTLHWDTKRPLLIEDINNDEDDEYVEKLLEAGKKDQKLLK